VQVHIVNYSNAGFYAEEIEHDHRNRHQIFVEGLGWEDLRRPDGREVDQYDNLDSTRLLLLKGTQVIGGLRLTPLTRPNLTFDHFADLVQRPLPDSLDRGGDWTRFYVTGVPSKLGPSGSAGYLYCAAMAFALSQGWTYLTFVAKPAMIGILLSIGWVALPLGRPRMIDGDLTLAGCIEVSELALLRAQQATGRETLELCSRGLPAVARPSDLTTYH